MWTMCNWIIKSLLGEKPGEGREREVEKVLNVKGIISCLQIALLA